MPGRLVCSCTRSPPLLTVARLGKNRRGCGLHEEVSWREACSGHVENVWRAHGGRNGGRMDGAWRAHGRGIEGAWSDNIIC